MNTILTMQKSANQKETTKSYYDGMSWQTFREMTDKKMEREEAFNWFVHGFSASGEGYNGEYPFGFDEDRIRTEIEDRFEEVWSDE